MLTTVVAKTAALGVMNFVSSLATRFFKNQKTDSLVRFTQATRVEPIALVDQRLQHLAFMPDVMQSLSSIFTGYYLQAVALAVNVGSVNVLKLLDALNPTRDFHGAAAHKIVDYASRESMMSLESYRYGLPVPGRPSFESGYGEAAGAVKEGFDEGIDMMKKHGATAERELKKSLRPLVDEINSNHLPEFGKTRPDDKAPSANVQFSSSLAKGLNEAVNLSVGKLVEVTVEDGGKKATFPITVRLISTIVGSEILAHILADGSRNISYKERFHAWRAGQLEFVKDLILCQDLIDEHRRTLMKDKSGTYANILERRSRNDATAMMTGTPSIGSASNLVVLSSQTAKELERAVEGKLSNPKVRNAIFTHTYVMILAVVDPEWEQITFYHRGIDAPTEMSIKELKASNKGTGPDVAEILKAFQLGSNPTF